MTPIGKLIPFVLVCLCGCAQLQTQVDTKVQQVVVPDLQAAYSAAVAANDADGAACWNDILQYVNQLPTTAPGGTTPTIAGVASALEAARIAQQGGPVLFPPIPHQLHKDCAVIVVDAQQVAAKFGIIVGASAAGVVK
jgi:hypothetical protein